MRQLVAILVSAIFFSSLAHARMPLETFQSGSGTSATPVNLVEQSGLVGKIHADERKIVIDGETYAYNPLTTGVTVNGKRAAISDVHSGEVVQFEAVSQGNNKLYILTAISVQIFSMHK